MSLEKRKGQFVRWIRRMVDDYANTPDRRCAANLIGWLSLVMLAAAWGSVLSSQIQTVWMYFGTLGLISAVGLDIRRRARVFQTKRHGSKELHKRVMQDLTRLAAQGANTDEIRKALQWIADTQQQGKILTKEQRAQVRIPVSIPIQLTPASVESEGQSQREAGCSRALVCEISSRGVGLLHRHRIADRKLILTFDLNDGQSMSLAAEHLWSERLVDGTYASGCKVLDVLTHANCTSRKPDHSLRESELVTATGDS